MPQVLLLVALALAMLAGCSSSSSGGTSCSSCSAIAQQITQHGGGNASCVEPTPSFAQACQAYEACLHQCGQ